jgi:hypothetical protein
MGDLVLISDPDAGFVANVLSKVVDAIDDLPFTTRNKRATGCFDVAGYCSRYRGRLLQCSFCSGSMYEGMVQQLQA